MQLKHILQAHQKPEVQAWASPALPGLADRRTETPAGKTSSRQVPVQKTEYLLSHLHWHSNLLEQMWV